MSFLSFTPLIDRFPPPFNHTYEIAHYGNGSGFNIPWLNPVSLNDLWCHINKDLATSYILIMFFSLGLISVIPQDRIWATWLACLLYVTVCCVCCVMLCVLCHAASSLLNVCAFLVCRRRSEAQLYLRRVQRDAQLGGTIPCTPAGLQTPKQVRIHSYNTH